MTWYEEFFGAIDAADADKLQAMLTEDTILRLGNKDEIAGHDPVMEATTHFWSMIGGMRHTMLNALEQADIAAFESIVEYTRLDGSTVEIPVTSIVERKGDKISAQRIYLDAAPLFSAEPAAVAEGASR